MTARRTWMGLGLAGAAAALSGCGILGGSQYRYKMTVEVETPQGMQRGFAVREVGTYARPNGGDGMSVRGEAVAVDIAPGKALYALLIGANGDASYAAGIANFALDRRLFPGGGNADYVAGDFAELYPTSPKTESPIKFGAMPLLVTFADPRDPKTVVRIEPDELATHFGPGVTLKRITIEKTHEELTVGIGKRFGWWKALKIERRRLNGSNSIVISSNDISDNIGTGEFSTGEEK